MSDFRVVDLEKADEIHLSTTLTLDEMEKEILVYTLASVDWSQKKAAKRLGVSTRVLNYKIHRVHGIVLPKRGEAFQP